MFDFSGCVFYGYPGLKRAERIIDVYQLSGMLRNI